MTVHQEKKTLEASFIVPQEEKVLDAQKEKSESKMIIKKPFSKNFIISPERSSRYKFPVILLKAYERKDFSDIYKESYAYQYLGLNDPNIDLSKIILPASYIIPYYVKKLNKLKNIEKYEINIKRTFKNLINI